MSYVGGEKRTHNIVAAVQKLCKQEVSANIKTDRKTSEEYCLGIQFRALTLLEPRAR
jgi:hypothetical protein